MIVQGDARTLPLVDACVQCVVTSPPYFGLRDYGTARWNGGNPACDHKSGRFERGGLSGKQASNVGSAGDEARSVCPKCGARRIDQQIGLESSPEVYVAALVGVYREVWRVLKDDGTVWLNLGDSYTMGFGMARGLRYKRHTPLKSGLWKGTRSAKRDLGNNGNVKDCGDLKPKDLIGIPWRVAFALQADGWYLRSDIIWAKPNPMPESVTDRPTKAHEYVFLLAKNERYFFDADAVREPQSALTLDFYGHRDGGNQNRTAYKAATARGSSERIVQNVTHDQKRNIRSVWSIATQPYAGAHFATMPEQLVERCILAGSRPGDLVLDPFAGSGTVGRVAWELNRRPVLIDLNPSYLALATNRTGQIQRSLLDVT